MYSSVRLANRWAIEQRAHRIKTNALSRKMALNSRDGSIRDGFIRRAFDLSRSRMKAAPRPNKSRVIFDLFERPNRERRRGRKVDYYEVKTLYTLGEGETLLHAR